MKKAISMLLILAALLTLCACQGNFGEISLQDAMEIPGNGIITKSTLDQIRKNNAIGLFYGESNGFKYEWTIFGNEITTSKDVNLSARIHREENGDIKLSLGTDQAFGFAALLSIHLNEYWNALSAEAYAGNRTVASVSLTGSKNTIVNLSLDGTQTEIVIRATEISMEAPIPTEGTQPPVATKPSAGGDDYLSGGSSGSDQVYSDGNGNQSGVTVPTAPSTSGGQDDYLSDSKEQNGQVYTDNKDKYQTDPVPEGKPKPVEPEDQNVDKNQTLTCTFSIECSTILNNLDQLDSDKLEMVPSNGVILTRTTVTFYEGESVFDVLQRVCREYGIHMEASWTPIYNSAYIEGIHNLYEFDCGNLSGWMYQVNGWYPNYGCSRYQLQDGDVVQWRYTCDLGNDVGGGYAAGG